MHRVTLPLWIFVLLSPYAVQADVGPSLELGSVSESASSTGDEANLGSFDFASVQIGGLFADQGLIQRSFSGQFSWTPSLKVTPDYTLRLNLGGAILTNNRGAGFMAIDYELLAGFLIDRIWLVEGGAGFQTWVSNGGTAPAVSFNFAWKPETLLADMIDRIYVGYTRFFVGTAGQNQVRAGVGFGI